LPRHAASFLRHKRGRCYALDVIDTTPRLAEIFRRLPLMLINILIQVRLMGEDARTTYDVNARCRQKVVPEYGTWRRRGNKNVVIARRSSLPPMPPHSA